LAHELKTPISVISSNMDVLKYGFDEKIVEKSKQELRNMTKIIDGLLDFSETIRLENKKDINLENFLKSQISFLDKSEQVEIKNNLFNFTIETDEVLFERVVKNLIENAIKHSSDKKLEIIMQEEKLIFKNNVFKDLTEEELEKIKQKFYSKSKT
jgi:two-component system OmpR family sensor kinase